MTRREWKIVAELFGIFAVGWVVEAAVVIVVVRWAMKVGGRL